MNPERIAELKTDFAQALGRLKDALDEDIKKGSIIVDGTIQRFEFTFEVAWKLLKAILNYNGIEVDTPRMVIKEAFVAKIIENGEAWIDMLEDRNKTAHIYSEATALKIYEKIKKCHYQHLNELYNRINSFDFI